MKVRTKALPGVALGLSLALAMSDAGCAATPATTPATASTAAAAKTVTTKAKAATKTTATKAASSTVAPKTDAAKTSGGTGGYTTAASTTTTSAAVKGDAANGEAIFKARCASCHTVTPDGKPGFTGPNLFQVVGRKSGTGMGFPYSDPMKNAGITWDATKLVAYIGAPSQIVPGGKMAFVGPSDAGEQTDVVAYLGSLK